MRLTITDLRNRIQARRVYLWGARQLGFSFFRALEREGLPPCAYLDSSPDLQGRQVLGRPVLDPQSILNQDPESGFIIITSGFFAEEIAGRCREAGREHLRDFVRAEELQTFDYQIDVSGSCNLRCVSCPRGNFSPQPEAGFMSPENFGLALDKILREDPLVGAVALYNWGEPLLHPQLPEIISICRKRGVHAAVSSNLSFKRDFSEVVKAGPTWFRASVSGVEKNYEITHTGGRWELFLENLHTLTHLKEQYASEMEIEVFYHIYKNRADDYRRLKELCQTLNLPLRVRHAALAPLDNIAAIEAGETLNPAVNLTRSLQSLSVEEAMAMARRERDLPCAYARCLHIAWDMTVRACMEWFHPDLKLVDGNFLDATLAEIAAARRDSSLCRSCRERAIHRCYNVYGDESLIERFGSLHQ
jgi:pyruvate-formate lyase-activating enzyme